MAAIYTPSFLQPQNINGVPLAGAKLYFYQTGTTTPITVYQDSGLTTPHANPVVADASGIFAPIYVGTAVFKVVLKTSADVTVQTVDPANNAGTIIVTEADKAAARTLIGATGNLKSVQTFTASGTWTKPANCVAIVIEAVGGGGGSGGVDGQGGGTYGASGGGGSGFYGETALLDVTATSSAAVTIGAAGAAGTAGANNGGAGGSTAITIGATTYTWGGGNGSAGVTAAATNIFLPGTGGTGTNVNGGSWHGTLAFGGINAKGVSGAGGSNPLGRGGAALQQTGTGNTAGLEGSGFGAGAGGPANHTSATDQAGALGSAGYMRVFEFY